MSRNRVPGLRQRLVGAWELQSYVEFPVDGGEPFEPLGDQPEGLLIYTPDGYMSAQFSRAGRTPFTSGDRFGGTQDEYSEAASTYIAYSGPFHVDEATGELTHSMVVSLFPNWIGQTQLRTVELEGDALTLAPDVPSMSGGRSVMSRLVWRRAPVNP